MGDALILADRLHGHPRPSRTLTQPRATALTSMRSKLHGALASRTLASIPGWRSVRSPTSDSAPRLICARGTPSRMAMTIVHRVTDSSPSAIRPLTTIVLSIGARIRAVQCRADRGEHQHLGGKVGRSPTTSHGIPNARYSHSPRPRPGAGRRATPDQPPRAAGQFAQMPTCHHGSALRPV